MTDADGKKGIVLTPLHIAKLMINILDIQKTDTFVDICAGTGNFSLLAFEMECKRTLSIEINQKMYLIL